MTSFIMSEEPKVVRSAFSKHDEPGTTVAGVVLGQQVTDQIDPKTKKAKTTSNGRVLQQAEVTILTRWQVDPDDDGRRKLFVKGNLQKAFRKAILAAGDDDLRVGATVTVTFTGTGQAFNADYSPPKLYSVKYEPPNEATLAQVGAFLEELAE
ncbi:hypothetical protein ACFVMC_33080 [Nocardia sp. NPDC127579]|uniref:hypothetical protein n=1 Tax=Nocardia sp. NPDC127579 TaxID=3345402 RepID=UPI003636116F